LVAGLEVGGYDARVKGVGRHAWGCVSQVELEGLR
jgi:hypothetical protein